MQENTIKKILTILACGAVICSTSCTIKPNNSDKVESGYNNSINGSGNVEQGEPTTENEENKIKNDTPEQTPEPEPPEETPSISEYEKYSSCLSSKIDELLILKFYIANPEAKVKYISSSSNVQYVTYIYKKLGVEYLQTLSFTGTLNLDNYNTFSAKVESLNISNIAFSDSQKNYNGLFNKITEYMPDCVLSSWLQNYSVVEVLSEVGLFNNDKNYNTADLTLAIKSNEDESVCFVKSNMKISKSGINCDKNLFFNYIIKNDLILSVNESLFSFLTNSQLAKFYQLKIDAEKEVLVEEQNNTLSKSLSSDKSNKYKYVVPKTISKAKDIELSL